jgi:ferrous iron transport protein B
LFGFISILEESGYMSSVSLLTDKVFYKLGMNGKSSVSLIGGLACAVPAIMGTRTIENYKDRLITILVTPLMSCSARLPVYVLLIGFVVPDKDLYGVINLQGLVMLGLYLLGFVTALLIAFILNIFIKVKETGTYIAELPIYRKPRWGNVFFTMYEKVRLFVWEAGKIIVLISILLWFLASYGPGNNMKLAEQSVRDHNASADTTELRNQIQSAKLNASYAGVMGRWIEPVITPLGFDWKIGIAIITSFAAREVFVGTMATIYSIGSNDEPDFTVLRDKMKQDINRNTGDTLYNTASGLSLIIFYVFAMQCMSTLAVVKRETKSWKWPVIQLIYMTVLAWTAAFFTYNVLS